MTECMAAIFIVELRKKKCLRGTTSYPKRDDFVPYPNVRIIPLVCILKALQYNETFGGK